MDRLGSELEKLMKPHGTYLHRWFTAALCAAAILTISLRSLSQSPSNGTVPRSRRAGAAVPEDELYKSPVQLALSKDGRQLFVACENTNEVLFVDTHERRVTRAVKVGAHPFGLTLSPDESRLYVSNRKDNSVSEIEVSGGRLLRTAAVPGDPHQLTTDPSGKILYVANMIANHVSLMDTARFEPVKTLEAGTYPFGLALAPDGRYIYVSNQLSNPVPFRAAPVLELTVVDARSGMVSGRRQLFSSVIGQGVAVSPDSQFVAVALEMPKNLLPETQVYQGWMVTHGIAVIEAGPKGRPAFFLLDDANSYYADPYGLAFSPDGKRLYVSSSGVDAVSVVDFEKLKILLQVSNGKIGASDEMLRSYARHLALSAEFVIARISTGSNPKGLLISPDGNILYVANRLSDTIQIIDTRKNMTVGQIDLGGPKTDTVLRRGEKLFNYSTISFQKQLSCNTCHPEYHVDGLLYDIVGPGDPMGKNLVDNRSQRGLAETAPFKWNGKNPTLARQDGPRAAMLFFRSHGFDAGQLQDLVKFVESIPVPFSRYLGKDQMLNEFQEEGKKYFERDFTKDGRYIPVNNRCFTCHRPPYYTDQKMEDVGTKADHDDESSFDTPHLGNVAETAPYLHDGRCYSLEEIWTVYNLEDLHGVTNDLDKRQLNVLIEYIKTLTVGVPMSDKEMMATLFPPTARARSNFKLEEKVPAPDPPYKYVGNLICAGCHMKQYKDWLGTKHARTWVMLQRDASKTIERELPITASHPQYSGVCLQCHATAANTPDEYRADGFHVEEGVQCERCHGPGSYHSSAETMRDKQKSKALGLRKATKEDCMLCHLEKPSHKILGRPAFNFDVAWSKIKH